MYPDFAVRVSSSTSALVAVLLTWQAPAAPPQFRARANVIQLDVSVLYGDRRPVRGLTAGDFVVLDDKQEQPIETFSEVTLPDWEPLPEGWQQNTPPDVVSNAGHPNGRLVAIVIDDVAPIPTPAAARNLQTIASLIVEQLSPGDRAGVFFGRARDRNERFTADRSRLMAAISRIGVDGPGRAYAWRTSALQALHGAVSAMSGAAPQSKTVFFITAGAPVNLGASFFGPDGEFADAFDGALLPAMQNNVRIHCIDPTVPPPPTSSPPTKLDRDKVLQKDMLTRLANVASGRVLANDEFLPRRINEVFNETRTYYLIGYRAPERVKRGIRRSIEVRITRPGLVVHTRDGYDPVVEDAKAPKPGAPSAELTTAIAPILGLPSPEVPLRLTALALGSPKDENVPVVILTGVLRDPLATNAAREPVDALLRLTAQTQDVRPRDMMARLRADVEADTGDPVLHEFVSEVVLKPGTHLVRIAAERMISGAIGSVLANIEVPDVRRTPLFVSGVAITSDRPGPRTMGGGWSGRLKDIPTIRREFDRNERVTATVHVTQGGKNPVESVGLTLRITDGAGRASTVTQVLPAGGFERDRASNATLSLSLDQLSAGPYLLSVEASTSRYRMHRDVPFRVR